MISPLEWLETANHMRPKLEHTTEWFSGLTSPTLPGWYERYFIDSPTIGDATMQWWDGAMWCWKPGAVPHWRQVADYPAWRGLNSPSTHEAEALNKTTK